MSICVDEADGSVTFSPSYPVDGEYEVDVNIIQETITTRRIDEELVTTDNVFVEDILTAVLSQPGGVGDNLDSSIITNTNPDAPAKVCHENGICNVKTQLPSKYFVVPNPAPLRVDGVAILSFGKASMIPSESPTQAPGNRRLRVPISGLISAENVKALLEQQQSRALAEAEAEEARQLQASESPFDLEVPLVSDVAAVQGEAEGGSNNMTMIIIAVIVVILLVLACAILAFASLVAEAKRRTRRNTSTLLTFSNIPATLTEPVWNRHFRERTQECPLDVPLNLTKHASRIAFI